MELVQMHCMLLLDHNFISSLIKLFYRSIRLADVPKCQQRLHLMFAHQRESEHPRCDHPVCESSIQLLRIELYQ